jgi:aspartate 1-decarboxylase
MITVFKSKIHRAIVTDANLNYEGSVTIDKSLMTLADIYEYEQVHIWNITNGNRLVTYALTGDWGNGVICVNGAGAHLNKPGDLVILATFKQIKEIDAISHKPIVVQVDSNNKLLKYSNV